MDARTNSGKTSAFSVYVKFFIFYTILWAIIVNVMDIIPKEGELKPHSDGWRPATQVDRGSSFVFLTMCFYGGGFFIVWFVRQVQTRASDTFFGGDPGYRDWREQGGDPFVDALGFPLNNQRRAERASTGPGKCCRCSHQLQHVIVNNVHVNQCGNCGMAWDGKIWWYPPGG
jgi:hypothetical protein